MGIVAQRCANIADALHNRILSHEDIGPDGLDQLFLGDEPAGMFDEIAQEVEGFGPELNLINPAQKRAALQIESVNIEAKRPGEDGTHPVTSTMTFKAAILPVSPAFRRDFVALSGRIVLGALFSDLHMPEPVVRDQRDLP